MSINSQLKREGITNIKPLNTLEINKIASNISDKICNAFPEHNINKSDLFIAIARLNMYTATMPKDHSAAKYFYKNCSIYFSEDINFDDIGTLALHESIHFIQEVKNKNKKLIRMGLYDIKNHHSGMVINEAAVQLMASIANNSEIDSAKYYGLNITTESPDYYPIECALIKQMEFFTGSYALFHSTLFGDNIFKNTFITKSSHAVYNKIEYNFDLLFHYQELLNIETNKLKSNNEEDFNLVKINYINTKINNIKKLISKITLETQELIITNCFSSELELVKDLDSLNEFKSRLGEFKNLLISSERYMFYDNFYYYMLAKLDEKLEIIDKYGYIDCIANYQTEIISQPQILSIKYFRDLFAKLKILFENYNYLRKHN